MMVTFLLLPGRYYHQSGTFHHLLRLISNAVVHRAKVLVGEDVLRDPLQVGLLIEICQRLRSYR